MIYWIKQPLFNIGNSCIFSNLHKLKISGCCNILCSFHILSKFFLAVQNILHFARQIFLMAYLTLEMDIFRHLALRHIGVLSLISLVESSLSIILATKLLRYQNKRAHIA